MKKFASIIIILFYLLSHQNVDAQVLNICEGDSLKLSTGILASAEATSVEWFKDNILISTDTAFKITQPGTYTLRCTNASGCIGDFSQPLTVIVDSLVANLDSISTQPNTLVNIKVLVNDQQACYPIDTPTMVIVHQGSNGVATAQPGGTFSYQPNPGFVGLDTFYYVIQDIHGNPSNIAMVIINITTNAPIPLGLSLVDFEAVKVDDEAHLYWNTASTSDASHFEVERSADGKLFEFKGKVMAPVQSNENTAYNYWDKKPLSGKNYYRLKLVSLNGTTDYSEIRTVNFDAINSNVNIYPNPATNYVMVDVGQQSADLNSIQVLDAIGNKVLEKKVSGSLNTIELNSLSPGIYFIRLVDKTNKLKDTAYKLTKLK